MHAGLEHQSLFPPCCQTGGASCACHPASASPDLQRPPPQGAEATSSQDSAQAPAELPLDSGSSRLIPPQAAMTSTAGLPPGTGSSLASLPAQQQQAQQGLPQQQQQQQQQQPTHSGSGPPSTSAPEPCEPLSEGAKREARMQRNRESAQLSRQRKKTQTGALERQCQELQTHNTHLTGRSPQAPMPSAVHAGLVGGPVACCPPRVWPSVRPESRQPTHPCWKDCWWAPQLSVARSPVCKPAVVWYAGRAALKLGPAGLVRGRGAAGRDCSNGASPWMVGYYHM